MTDGRATTASGRLRLHVFGLFRLTSPDGDDLTPASTKACALLAMLATASGMRRSRSWLQNRLWRDRSAAQAAGSLRQALLDIRKALGPYAGVLAASRSFVGLRSDHVEVAERPVQADAIFLGELNLREPAFLAWLNEARALLRAEPVEKRASARAPPLRPLVVIDVGDQPQTGHGFFARILYDHVARSLTEAVDVDVVRGPLTAEETMLLPHGALLVQLHVIDLPGSGVWIRASLEDLARTMIRWSGSSKLAMAIVDLDENWQILGLVHQLVFAVLDVLSRDEPDANAGQDYQAAVLAAGAFRRMFRLRHHDLEAAAAMIDRAIEAAPRGLFHAVRAQLSTIRFVERHGDPQALSDSVDADVAAALAAEPMNSTVLASVANARIVFRNDVASSLVLARQGARANRSNPLAWWSLANATLYAGEHEEAYAAAVTAQLLAEGSALKSWTDFQRSLTSSVQGRFAEGVAFARSAHALAPGFRPPLRYLIALEAQGGNARGVVGAAEKLKALEPDFTIRRMMSDSAYPASMLRRSRLAAAPLLKTLDQ